MGVEIRSQSLGKLFCRKDKSVSNLKKTKEQIDFIFVSLSFKVAFSEVWLRVRRNYCCARFKDS